MRILIVPALIAPAFALLALAGSVGAETRNLQGFTGVGAAGRFNVEVEIGDHYLVEVTGADADKIETRVEGDSLRIRATGWHPFGEPEYAASVHVVMPRVNA